MSYSQIIEKCMPIPAYMNKISGEIVDAAVKVHIAMGKSLTESAYEEALALELRSRGLDVQRQVVVPLEYEDYKMESILRIDMLVEDCIIVELKATKEMYPAYEAQLITYLEKTGKRLGLLINFGGNMIKGNVLRRVN